MRTHRDTVRSMKYQQINIFILKIMLKIIIAILQFLSDLHSLEASKTLDARFYRARCEIRQLFPKIEFDVIIRIEFERVSSTFTFKVINSNSNSG